MQAKPETKASIIIKFIHLQILPKLVPQGKSDLPAGFRAVHVETVQYLMSLIGVRTAVGGQV